MGGWDPLQLWPHPLRGPLGSNRGFQEPPKWGAAGSLIGTAAPARSSRRPFPPAVVSGREGPHSPSSCHGGSISTAGPSKPTPRSHAAQGLSRQFSETAARAPRWSGSLRPGLSCSPRPQTLPHHLLSGPPGPAPLGHLPRWLMTWSVRPFCHCLLSSSFKLHEVGVQVCFIHENTPSPEPRACAARRGAQDICQMNRWAGGGVGGGGTDGRTEGWTLKEGRFLQDAR